MQVELPPSIETGNQVVSPPPPTTMSAPASLSAATSPNESINTPTQSAPLVKMRLSCKVNAVHRLWTRHLSEQVNLDRYGAATRIHGHEYTFFVTFEGAVCSKTGQMIALDLLEEILPLSIVEHLAHKNLDQDLSYFLGRPSTIENVCMFAWRNIGVVTRPHPIRVVRVEVESEPCRRNEWSSKIGTVRVSYEGETTMIPSIP
ncbi:hypothetical protein JCM11491_004167 [Sporobolomyces phaffii]